jgi:environmental stress-induced protein Ves
VSRFELSQLPAVPWRNGGGQTREIGSGRLGPSPAAAAAVADWDWRLSVATIAADGPFSGFAGVDRVAVLVDGGVDLVFDDAALAWRAPGDAHAFAGEARCSARCIEAPARFFNVMTRRERARAQVAVHQGSFALASTDALVTCLLVLGGDFEVIGPEGRTLLTAEQGWLLEGALIPARVVMHSAVGCAVAVQMQRVRGAA